MTTPTPQQLAKLPKWAQDHVTSLERQLETVKAAWKRQGGLQNVRVRHRGRELTITADAHLNHALRTSRLPEGYKLLSVRWKTINPSYTCAGGSSWFESRRVCDATWGREYTRKVLVLIKDRK